MGLDAALGGSSAAAALVLADWTALARRPTAPERFRHVVLVDPAPSDALEELAASGAGFVHLAFGPAEVQFAERVLTQDWNLRAAIGEIWGSLTAAGGSAAGPDLRLILGGSSRYPRAAEVAGRCVRVLCELGLCRWTSDSAAPSLRVLSSDRTDLGRSRAYIACLARHQEAIRFLQSRAQA
jgi:hypothetical protein